jgi:hypothetical protein
MDSFIRPKLSYSNVVATIALFVALGGAAVAAGLPRHSVGPRQLKHGAVTSAALRRGAVKAAKLAKGSVIAGKLASGSVLPGAIATGAVTSTKIASNAITGTAIATGAIGAGKLAGSAVTTAKIANGAVTNAKLDDEVAPLLGTLRSGQTLRGVFDLGTKTPAGGGFVSQGASFPFPLAGMPAESSVLEVGKSNAACPGVTGTNLQTPNASPGNLCVYFAPHLEEVELKIESPSRLGFGLRASATGAGEEFDITGFWAVTAP